MHRKLALSLLIAAFLASCLFSAEVTAGVKESQPKPSQSKVEKAGDNTTNPVPEGPAPEIFFPDSTHDFGQVAQSTTLTHVFKVQNKGEAPLKITKVHAS
jgi:hypothetical protein